MANVSVYNMEGKEVGTIELNDAVFGVEINEHLVHMAVVQRLANKRQGTQKAKTRAEFAPTPRDYSFKLNKKEKRAALRSALTSKVQDTRLIVVDELKFDEIKTKNFVNVMNNLKVNKGLVVLAENDKNVIMSARNVAAVDTTVVNNINVYDVMKANTLVLTRDAVAKIEEVYA